MKINPSLVSKIYKAGTPAETHTEKAAPSVTPGVKTDMVVISPQGRLLPESWTKSLLPSASSSCVMR